MNPPRTNGIPPLLGLLALLTLSVWLAGQLGLVDWAESRGFGWPSFLFLTLLVPPILAERTYPVLREPRLYLLAFSFAPVGLVHALYDTRLLEQGLEEPLARLATASFYLLPLCVLAATALPAQPSRQRLRRLTAAFLLGEAALGALWLVAGPEGAPSGPWSHRGLVVPALVAASLAFALWRSQAGLGGAVAGLVVLFTAAGLAHVQQDVVFVTRFLHEQLHVIPEDEISAGELPAATARVLRHLLPLAVAGVFVYEWIVNLSHRTSHDALTQIYNKAHAEAIMNQTASTRLGEHYSVALADIDHFKRVNDTFGHSAGDLVLQETARAIREHVGARGVVCRTGGEEITVFFPGLPLAEARELCEGLRKAVQATTLRVGSPHTRKRKVEVTLSIGIASNIDEAGEVIHHGVAEVVEAADRAAYSAKRRGRNQVVTMLKE